MSRGGFAATVLAICGAASTLPAQENACPIDQSAPAVCSEGAIGSATVDTFEALGADEVDSIVRAAARALDVNSATIAVVDRAGRPLAVFRQTSANEGNDDLALGVARTAAFASHNMAPLSSRTVHSISGFHFPLGVTNAAGAPLFGVENTNRGCELNVVFLEGKCLPPARSLNGLPCRAGETEGCGRGIVTGREFMSLDEGQLLAGGIPLYRIVRPGADRVDEGIVSNGKLVGAIGVVGIDGDPQLAEFAAVSGAFGAIGSPNGPIVPVPSYPLPEPGNVFIDGVRLPFLGPDQRLTFNENGLPVGIARLEGTQGGSDAGTYVLAPLSGGCAPNGYLVGPLDGSRLSAADVDGIVSRAIARSTRTRAAIRLPLNSYARMVIAVADVDGSVLALYRMPDATMFSPDVSVAKARNVVYFSSGDPAVALDLPGIKAGTAVTSRTVGYGAQPYYPPGMNGRKPRVGPFYNGLLARDSATPCSQGSQATNPNQNGVVFFAGSTPLYRDGHLAGGLGVSGDGVDQDDYVAYYAAGAFLPPANLWADRIKIDRVRMPMFKFPRQPEGVTECGSAACD